MVTSGLGTRASRLAWRLSDSLALDVRSLALSRMALGVLLLLDLRERAALLHDFYTDDGFVPRDVARSLWAAVMPHALPPWSLHLLGGSAAFQSTLFALQAACAVALIVGYRARVAAAAAYVLLVSVCQRDVLVTGGDEWMLAAFLFWAAFVPLDRALSVHAARSKTRARGPKAPVFSLGTFAFTAQLAMVLFFAALQKLVSSSAWRDGSAIHQVLGDMPATPFGLWLGTLPLVDCILNYGVLAAELIGPWLLILPVSSRVRTVAVLYIGVNLLGFAAALDVGRLPWVAMAALVAHLPGRVWQGARSHATAELWQRAERAPGDDRASLTSRVVLVAALLHAVVFNVARLGGDVADPSWLEAPAGVLVPRQGWGMFRKIGEGGVPQWFVVAGVRRGDVEPTVRLPDGRPFDMGPDSSVSKLQANERWGYFWSRADLLATDYPDVLQRFLRRQCEDWRANIGFDRVEIIWVRRHGATLEHEILAARACVIPAAPRASIDTTPLDGVRSPAKIGRWSTSFSQTYGTGPIRIRTSDSATSLPCSRSAASTSS